MLRRNWFVAVGSLFAATMGLGTTARQRRKCDRDHEGNSMMDCYRIGPDGYYWRVADRADLKEGDDVIFIGLDGDRLWTVYQQKIGEGGSVKKDKLVWDGTNHVAWHFDGFYSDGPKRPVLFQG